MALAVLSVSVIAAVFETLGVASILPFMTLVLDPGAIERFVWLRSVAAQFGISAARDILLLVGSITVGVVALGNVAVAVNVVVQQRFAARTQTRLAAVLFAGYLRRPYAFHVKRDAPSLMKVVLIDCNYVVTGIVTPFMVGFAKLATSIGILLLLFLHDPTAALTATAALGVAYIGIYHFVRPKQARLGSVANDAHLRRQRVSQEGLGGIKELKVLGRESATIESFRDATSRAAFAQASNAIISQLPRHGLEIVTFGGVLLVTLGLVANDAASSTSLVSVLALYAFAGYRLMPSLQQVFGSALSIRFRLPALYNMYDDFMEVLQVEEAPVRAAPAPAATASHAAEIRLDHVTFAYPGTDRPVLRDVSLTVGRGECTGFVGRTGAGKTTLADLILGLYTPSSGRILIDGRPLDSQNLGAWQRRVGYVPQSVFLANASVAENVAFGLPPEEIDLEGVRRALRAAQAEDFLATLPSGLETILGERGVKLSGGQRQRIGIARALYHEPHVLIFDEATSALDGLTEDAVIKAIDALSRDRTIILIAHRLRTVTACDSIVMLDGGAVVATGGFDDLVATSDQFRNFVGRVVQDSAETSQAPARLPRT